VAIQGAQTQEAKNTRSKYKLEKAAGKSRYEVAPGQRIAVGLGLIKHLKPARTTRSHTVEQAKKLSADSHSRRASIC